uniref:Ubiquitin-like protease family profile domain-containing protein n=1 Tax=Noctiluca scintillans TaxID=2966 RepID=A0A7S1AQR6_NOCSC|mmetsp:Transcript_56103/g.149689  ORF Transcript_56103/g.149689 Transcript_56103/m.149689 type:complete len:552 (+) Transcript_56103:87-1742(+)
MVSPVSELTFRRSVINLRDAARLGEGEDLNDALLDFFARLGQSIIPSGGKSIDSDCPTAYLGSLFFQKLTSAFVNSGEEGWKQVSGWAKRKAGNIFSPHYGAIAIPINEDLKDEKGENAGNHWWLALLLHPSGGAKGEPTSVMCLDSMQRREKVFSPPLQSTLEGSSRYTLEVTKIEQAGYIIIISFSAKGDGSLGPLQRPEASRLQVDGLELSKPTLGLRINMCGGKGVQGTFEGTLTFELDGRIRSSSFLLLYGETAHSPIQMQFDPFQLTKMQKSVSRFLGGYLAKEWEVNGPNKKQRFEKMSARALVADVYQQENLNDCGVFVLENMLRSVSLPSGFLKKMAGASSEVLRDFPWPTQQDITMRKAKLKAITARLFAAAAEKNCQDVEKMLRESPELLCAVLGSLTESGNSEDLVKWSGSLHKELAARQVEKDALEAEKQRKEELVQARREEERSRREEQKKRMEEERLRGANPPKRHALSSSRSRSRSPSSKKDKRKKEKEKVKKREAKVKKCRSSRSSSRSVSRHRSKVDKKRSRRDSSSRSSRRG